MKIKKEALQAVTTELDALLFDKPQMSVKLEPDKLAEEIKEASVLLQSDDSISPDTVDILSQIWKGCESELEELAKEKDTKNIVEAFQTLGIISESKPEEKEKEEKAAKEKKGTKKDEKKAAMKIVPKDEPEKKITPKAGTKKPGVIAGIVSCIEKSGRKGISKEQILDKLINLFPDREEKSMKNTINVQVPARITKEKFPVEKTKDGNYRKA